jgi:hypothetical protein
VVPSNVAFTAGSIVCRGLKGLGELAAYSLNAIALLEEELLNENLFGQWQQKDNN